MKAGEGGEEGEAWRQLGSLRISLERLAEWGERSREGHLGFTWTHSSGTNYVSGPGRGSGLGILRTHDSCPASSGDRSDGGGKRKDS